ncbi:glycoside hydrolase family protein [Paracoccus sediminilitoris]|uniref:glycoside hydrolase family 88 protein n=1 Tax=Paracoccus sediminilitoris TaxID=2202419 RepID=UPI0018F2A4EF|nr:glycoside hydrolase family 88 protein [Paracoccus sediminilitoris]
MDRLFPRRDDAKVSHVPAADNAGFASTILEDILSSLSRNSRIIGTRNPMVGGHNDSIWRYPDNGYFWTDSFFTGELWLAFMVTGQSEFRNFARMRITHLERLLHTPLWLSHDLGFLYSLSAVADFKLTRSPEARRLALQAADALRARFNWAGNYILAWTADGQSPEHASRVQAKMIIDSVQNLPLLLWAYEETGIDSYRDVALRHADSLTKYIVRSDFSTYHTFDFDPASGRPVGGKTWQGRADESCWSRGQAWAIHGFAQLAEITGDLRLHDLAAKLADHALAQLGPDHVPVWDYRLPEGAEPIKDSSAGSITSAGLFIIADIYQRTADVERASHYRNAALGMLQGLRENHDLTGDPAAQGLLGAGASDVPRAERSGDMYLTSAMLPYGDYYYFEAVLRALGHREFFWH